MLKLHGFSASNYYNVAKLALLEKGAPFEESPAARVRKNTAGTAVS